MANSLLARHAESLEVFGARVHAVRDDQWDAPTPCTEWTVRDLVNHLTGEQLWVVPLVRDGLTMEDVGDRFDGDVLGDDPVGVWDRAAAEAVEAFREEGALGRTVHLSYGETPAEDYCRQMVDDAVIHAWDLSRAIGADEQLPKALVDFATRDIAPQAAGLSKSGLFAPPVKTPPGADPQTKLLAMVGRKA
ncbi:MULTISPECIES: TIGR03086 family metal-binding protein [unclassified Streptomyces]|uniref:TIGR03086 family metal-binding protein n=1 Tax=unclassified Streptomyces TaxID=2593676 RepID=UPI00339F0195